MSNTRVIFNHDAAIDEYMAAVLLTTMENVDTLGFVVTNADCIDVPAMCAHWKIQQFIDRTDIPLSLSRARGWNPFPWLYREDCIKQMNIAALYPYSPPEGPPFTDGDAWLAQALDEATEPITMLVNCPMTTLRSVLDCSEGPARAEKIERLIWMGGAINVPGNLDPTTLPPLIANRYAEWNAFFDPYSIDWVFKNTTFPITVFPLDVTDQAKITDDFKASLFRQSETWRYSRLADESYAIVADESFYDMWDVLTTCFIPHPEFFESPTPMKLSIITDGLAQQARLVQADDGRQVDVVLELAKPDDFYAYVLAQFARN